MLARIGTALRALPDPDMAEFYTSGRASNEAAFLYQLFAREFGTNNFPDCSNMCHEATSVGLPGSIGVGKGTVTLEDFDHSDAIFCIGHNPGTNHPRMLTTLTEASRRGVADHRDQPTSGTRASALYAATKSGRDADAEFDADCIVVLSGQGRRRHRSAEGDDENPAGFG
jgi:anaerobic selenocysteine-containing dehydrogenase